LGLFFFMLKYFHGFNFIFINNDKLTSFSYTSFPSCLHYIYQKVKTDKKFSSSSSSDHNILRSSGLLTHLFVAVEAARGVLRLADPESVEVPQTEEHRDAHRGAAHGRRGRRKQLLRRARLERRWQARGNGPRRSAPPSPDKCWKQTFNWSSKRWG
jgi:hypothetical protein